MVALGIQFFITVIGVSVYIRSLTLVACSNRDVLVVSAFNERACDLFCYVTGLTVCCIDLIFTCYAANGTCITQCNISQLKSCVIQQVSISHASSSLVRF